MIIRALSTPEFVRHAPELVDVYIAAMGYEPSIRDSRISAWRTSTRNAGFRAIVAYDEHEVLGITYGHLGSPHQWWYRQVLKGLYDKGGPTHQEQATMNRYFELAELHVLPKAQNMGLGKQLVEKLLEGASADTVLLSTPEVANENNNAFGLYRKLGFKDLLRNFLFTGDPRPFAVLQAPIPLTPQSV